MPRKYTLTEKSNICQNCGEQFSYVYKAGVPKQHCSPECRTAWKVKRVKIRLAECPRCKIDGCEKPAVRVGAGMCETHYYRVRRGKSPNEDPSLKFKYRYNTSGGYIKIFNPQHELADKSGTVFEHRSTAYRKHEGKCPACYWCGKELVWAGAVIDHLDEDKQNNAPNNLVVACSPCNRARGAMLPFISRMCEDKIPEFIAQVMAYRKR